MRSRVLTSVVALGAAGAMALAGCSSSKNNPSSGGTTNGGGGGLGGGGNTGGSSAGQTYQIGFIGALYVAANNFVYGATVQRSSDGGKTWERSEGLGLPEETGLTLEKTWHVEPGHGAASRSRPGRAWRSSPRAAQVAVARTTAVRVTRKRVRPPNLGMVSHSPPSRRKSRVWVRSCRLPERKNSAQRTRVERASAAVPLTGWPLAVRSRIAIALGY